MKKFTIKNIFGMFLAIAIMLSTSAFAYTYSISDFDINASNERVQNEQNANIAYANINESFVLSDGTLEYNDSYAGAYLNDEGCLVVLIATSDDTQSEQKLFSENGGNILSPELQLDSTLSEHKSVDFREKAETLQNLAKVESSNIISFQEAKYSYKYLTRLMEQLNKSSTENSSNPDSIWSEVTSFALLDDKNCISIEMLNIDNSKIERFRTEVNNSDALCFSNSAGVVEQQTTELAPGSGSCKYTSSSTVKKYSIGYWGRHHLGNNQYEYGYVTAGHSGLSVGDEMYRLQGTTVTGPIGVCTVSQDDAELDAAFIKLNSNYDLSTETVSGVELSRYNSFHPAVGTTVFKEGAETGKSSGKVTSVNASYKFNNVTYIKLLSADYNSGAGDSGGVVYSTENSVVGIHVAGVADGVSGPRYITTANRIDAILSIYP